MAVIKFGSFVTSGRGSLGGSTIQPCHSGHILRNKPNPKKSRSQAQSVIRGYNKTMQAGWRDLSDQDRKVWNDYARVKPVFNRSGEKHPLSGHSLWLKYQFPYISNYLPFLSNPANYLSEPLGPELIDQALWATPGYWSLLYPGWSADGTKLISSLGTNGITKYNFWNNLNSYQSRLTVNVTNPRLYSPYDGYSGMSSIWVSGFHVTVFNMTNPGRTNLWLYSIGFIGSITSISIKQIL